MVNTGSIRARSTKRPVNAAISVHSQRANKPKSTSATYNISSIIKGKAASGHVLTASRPSPRIDSYPILHGAGE